MPYWQVKNELSLYDNLLLLWGKHIVVPHSIQKETLEKISSGHKGIQHRLLRDTSSIWWPQVKHQLQVEQLVQNCPVCTKARVPQHQPMIASELPRYPWERVASDFSDLHGKTYLLVADSFHSRGAVHKYYHCDISQH